MIVGFEVCVGIVSTTTAVLQLSSLYILTFRDAAKLLWESAIDVVLAYILLINNK